MGLVDKRLASLSPEKQKLFDMLLRNKGLPNESPNTQDPRMDDVSGTDTSDKSDFQLKRPLKFSLFFFSEEATDSSVNKYDLILESAKLADRLGFHAIWTPERHFHPFGGLYPNPSVLSAALAMITSKLELRAGSVVMPLHHPIRIAEEWSVVDNLSRGRVGLGFASGWHMDDFVFAPGAYELRKDVTFRNIEVIKKLWAGEAISWPGANGRETKVGIYPRPISKSLPIWITSAGSEETFIRAGEIGANVLTGLTGQSLDELGRKVGAYRQSLAQNGYSPDAGQVSLMLHTFVGENDADIKKTVRGPMCNYLKTNLGLHRNLAQTRNSAVDVQNFTAADEDALLTFAFERYFNGSALFGTPLSCTRMLKRLNEIEIDEACCLIDFGIDAATILEGIRHLASLKDRLEILGPPRVSTPVLLSQSAQPKGANHV
jgi:natural product biosynthesis luciferase-like monooxygenase protein